MSEWLVDTLETELSQEIKITRDLNLQYIRLHILKVGDPLGQLRCSIKKDGVTLRSESFDSKKINDDAGFNPNEYQLGFFTFEFDNLILRKNRIYNIVLEGISGYVFSEPKHYAWVIENEWLINFFDFNNERTLQDLSDSRKPYSFQLLGKL